MCPWDSGHVHQLSSPEKGRNTSTLLMNALELLLIQTVFGKRNALDQAGWKRWYCYPSAETIPVITKCIFKDTDTSVLTAGILLGHKVLESLCGFQNQTGESKYSSFLAFHILWAWIRGGFPLRVWENWLESVSPVPFKGSRLDVILEGIFNACKFCGKN